MIFCNFVEFVKKYFHIQKITIFGKSVDFWKKKRNWAFRERNIDF